MLDIIPSNRRHFSDLGWLKTCWLFSSANCFDPPNNPFDSLRIFNDGLVGPGTGFLTLAHQETETLVLAGEMTHEDSMGNKALIK